MKAHWRNWRKNVGGNGENYIDANIAASGDLDAAEGLARGALAEKEADAERLRDVLEGIARRRADL